MSLYIISSYYENIAYTSDVSLAANKLISFFGWDFNFMLKVVNKLESLKEKAHKDENLGIIIHKL